MGFRALFCTLPSSWAMGLSKPCGYRWKIRCLVIGLHSVCNHVRTVSFISLPESWYCLCLYYTYDGRVKIFLVLHFIWAHVPWTLIWFHTLELTVDEREGRSYLDVNFSKLWNMHNVVLLTAKLHSLLNSFLSVLLSYLSVHFSATPHPLLLHDRYEFPICVVLD